MNHPGKAAETDEVRSAEQSLYAAMIGKDFALLERILAPTLIYVHSTGVAETKAEYLAGVADRVYEYESIESRKVVVKIRGDVALSSGTVDMSVSAKDEPKTMIRLLFVLAWVKRADIWQLEHRHATRQH